MRPYGKFDIKISNFFLSTAAYTPDFSVESHALVRSWEIPTENGSDLEEFITTCGKMINAIGLEKNVAGSADLPDQHQVASELFTSKGAAVGNENL